MTSPVRLLREHGNPVSPDSTENRLRVRGFWPLVEEVCAKHHVLPSETLPKKPRYTREIYMARQELFVRIRETTNYGLPSIAALFGIDHTTVLYAIRKYRP